MTENIITIGLDVHKDFYMAAAYSKKTCTILANARISPTLNGVLEFIKAVRDENPECEIEVGYEAGCTGYPLYRQLTGNAVPCMILAPSTMPAAPESRRKKTDKRDAKKIAVCLANGTYSAVRVPTEEDEQIRDFIRMREDHLNDLKRKKQQILSFCLRRGLVFRETKTFWTRKHREWLHSMEVSAADREILDEYLLTLEQLEEKIARYDERIHEIAEASACREKIRRLCCLLGIGEHIALSLIAEVGDFHRFPVAGSFSSYLGLVPGEHSSGGKRNGCGLTKTGNGHLRRLLIEAAGSYTHGTTGYKPKKVTEYQKGQPTQVIACADRCNERLRRRFKSMIFHGKAFNVAKAAVARELACFIWALMTDHLDTAQAA